MIPNKACIHVFESKESKNFFTPIYKYFLYENILKIDLKKLKNYILRIEKNILRDFKSEGDGNTGLGNDSLTSRHHSYNLFSFNETKYLIESIKKNYNLFLKELKVQPPSTTYGKCWANVMRKGDQIKRHRHAIDSKSYLSGHLCVKTNKTNTYYRNPYSGEVFKSENKPGKLTIFPSWMEHYTDVASCLRITVAFDLFYDDVPGQQLERMTNDS